MAKFFDNSGPYSLADLAKEFGLRIYKNCAETKLPVDISIADVNTLENAKENSISFFSNKKYFDQFKNTKAGACVTSEKYIKTAPKDLILLVSDNPYAAFAKIANKFYDTIPKSQGTISELAYVSSEANLAENVEIMENSFISTNAKIGNNVKIFPNVYIGENVEIGDNCVIHHSATIQKAIIGENSIIHPGVKIGQDGFGYAFDNGSYVRVPQIGGVIIGKNVEIGANTTIDRGTIANTVIGDMCKIDNLVQIAHNVKLGIGCIIVSQVGISGSTEIGNYVQIGGQAGLAGHLKVGDKAQIAAQSGIIQDLNAGETYMGTPAMPIKQFLRSFAILKKMTK